MSTSLIFFLPESERNRLFPVQVADLEAWWQLELGPHVL